MGKKIAALFRNKQFHDLFFYVIVGGLATVVEWVLFRILTAATSVHYLWATAIAFFFSTAANWLFGRLLVFKYSSQTLLREIGSVYLASIAGLLLNLGIMYVLVQLVHMDEMLAKMVATVLVFAYNYLVRKLLIYKNAG